MSRIRVETRSEEHTSELQSRTQISYAVFCLKKKNFFNDTATTEIYTPSIFPYTTLFRSVHDVHVSVYRKDSPA